MKYDGLKFLALSPAKKKTVQLILCEGALTVWRDYAGGQGEINYVETVLGTAQIVDVRLPVEALTAVQGGQKNGDAIRGRYREPIAAMHDGDLKFPEHAEFAYNCIYNLFRRYVLEFEIDDWLIVNQALSALPQDQLHIAFDRAMDRIMDRAISGSS